MSSETPEQEEQIIRLTETWMHKNSRMFRMPWLVLPAETAITPRYVIRYFFAMFARLVIMYLLLFSALTTASVAANRHLQGFYQRLFSVTDPLSSADARYTIDTFWRIGLLLIFFALFLCIAFTVPLAQYAIHWNRRAKRLQSTLGAGRTISDPGVWPPPPQIVD